LYTCHFANSILVKLTSFNGNSITTCEGSYGFEGNRFKGLTNGEGGGGGGIKEHNPVLNTTKFNINLLDLFSKKSLSICSQQICEQQEKDGLQKTNKGRGETRWGFLEERDFIQGAG